MKVNHVIVANFYVANMSFNAIREKNASVNFRIYSMFGLMPNVPVNSYSHVGMVSSFNQIFSWASLTKRLTSTLCIYDSKEYRLFNRQRM